MNCNTCDLQLKSNRDYKLHLKSNKHLKKLLLNNIYECDKCDYRDNLINGIKTHYIRNHISFNFNCNNCDFHTDTEKHYNKHQLSIKHILTIDEDDLSDNQFDILEEHENKTMYNDNIDTDGFVNYICNDCNFETPLKTRYTEHINTIKHLRNIGGTKYECKKCNYTTWCKDSFYKHNNYSLSHKRKIGQIKPKSTKSYCDICNKHYSNKSHFNKTSHIVKQLKIDINFYDL